MALDEKLAYSPENLLDFNTLTVAFLEIMKHSATDFRKTVITDIDPPLPFFLY